MVRDFLDGIVFALQHVAFMGVVASLVYVVSRIVQQGVSGIHYILYILCTITLYIVLVLLHVLGGRVGVLGMYVHTLSFSGCVAYELGQDLLHPFHTITDFIDSFSEPSVWFRVRAVANFVFWGVILLAFLYAELVLLGMAPKVP